MRRTSVGKFLTSIVIASLALAGPLAPLAHAQQSDQPAESAQAAEPAQAVPQASQTAQAVQVIQPAPIAQPMQPAPPAQPDLFQETLKAEAASGRQRGLYATEAVVVNMVRVPGKAVTCAAGSVVGVGILILSLGSGYRPASAIFHEGCTGKWWLSGDDVRPDMPASLVTTDPGR
jgi:glucose/arabinose dehydrogenase